MDGQHQYEINLKKDGLFINLSSDDVYFISKQMDKWFRILLDDSYVPVTLPQRPQPAPEQQVAAAPQQPQTPVYTEQAPVAPPAQMAPQPAPAILPEQPVVQAPVQPQAAPSQYADVNLPLTQQQAPVAPAQPQQVVQQAAPAPQMPPQLAPQQPMPVQQIQQAQQPVQQVQQPAPQPQLAAVGAAPQGLPPQIAPAAQDDFEAVMDSLMKDLEEPVEAPELPVYAPAADNGASYGNLPVEPDLSLITSLTDLCDRSNAGNSEDYLLLTTYYLTRIEQQTSFSLKKVNTALVKSGLTPVNHSVLETVLSRGFLSMVPDLTGTAEVSEYMITVQGQQAALQLL